MHTSKRNRLKFRFEFGKIHIRSLFRIRFNSNRTQLEFNKETNNLVLLDKSFNDFFNKTPVVVEDNHMVSQPLLLSFNGVKYDFPI